MIVGLGADIIENERIGRVYSRHGVRFLQKIFTEDEIHYSVSHEDPVPYLAARFAVKEAAVKALNLKGGAGVSWKDVEVAGKIFGKKQLALHGRARELADAIGVTRMHLTLSHTHTFSMAVVVFEKL